MFVTILTGQVSHENWGALKKSFEKVVRHPPNKLLQSFMVQSEDDPTTWQIISLWPNKQAFLDAEQNDEANICVKLFCDAGSVPNRRGFQIVERYERV